MEVCIDQKSESLQIPFKAEKDLLFHCALFVHGCCLPDAGVFVRKSPQATALETQERPQIVCLFYFLVLFFIFNFQNKAWLQFSVLDARRV